MPNSEKQIQELLQSIDLLSIRGEDDWTRLVQMTQGYPDAKEVQPKLGWLLGETDLTVVLERHYIDKDFRDIHSAYLSKRFHTPSNRCIRLHFFRGEPSLKKISSGRASYLGYSVLGPISPGGLGRTLVSAKLIPCPPRQSLHAKICRETVHLLGTEYQVAGFPYTCQDGEVARCAQASLWMLVRCFSNKYPNYREIGPHQLANLVADLHLGRLFPSDGLTVWQSAEILRKLGFHPVVHDRRTFEGSGDGAQLAARLGFSCPKKAFAHLFYTYIESGIPLLVATKSHALVAFGHLSDYRMKPEKDDRMPDGFVPSSALNRSFVIHDDARLPYARMDLDHAMGSPSFEDVRAFIAPMPEKTFLPADAHQRLMREVLTNGDHSMAHYSPELAKAAKKGDLVLRSFLTTGTRLKASIHKRGLPTEFAEAFRHYSLPHFVWITEILRLENYPDCCIGQVVWDATASPENWAGFLFIHYPGKLLMNCTPHFNRPLGPLPDDIRLFSLQTAGAEFPSFAPLGDNLNHRS